MNTASKTPAPSVAVRRRGRPARGNTGGGQVQSLSRALSLLEHIAGAEAGISLSDLSTSVGLAASTTHRLLSTLELHGFATLDTVRGVWTIGIKAFTVGSAFLSNRDVIATARPYMRQLMEQAGESVNLAMLDRDHAVFLSQIECREMMRMLVALGSRAPLHASGAGKALLAALSEHDFERVIHRAGLPRWTDNTIVSEAILHDDVRQVRRRGYALDNEEHAVGLRCVAATIHDQHSEAVAALSLSGPRARITDDRLDILGALVVSTADRVTRAYGGTLPPWRSG